MCVSNIRKAQQNLMTGDMAAAFSGKEVDISAICFMRVNKRSKLKGNFLNIFVQEMKNPPFSDEQVEKGREVIAKYGEK